MKKMMPLRVAPLLAAVVWLTSWVLGARSAPAPPSASAPALPAPPSASAPALPAPPSASAPALPAPAEPKTAEEVLERHIEALGGRDRLNNLKTRVIVTKRTAAGREQIGTAYRDIASNKFYNQTKDQASGIVVEAGFDGKRMWENSMMRSGYVDENDPRARNARKPEPPLWRYKETGRKLEFLGKESFEGRPVYKLKGTTTATAFGKETPVNYYFDAGSFLLVKQAIELQTGEQSTLHSDYRMVDGMQVAFRTKLVTSQITVETETLEVKNNLPIDPALFEFKGASAPALPAPPSASAPALQTAGSKDLSADVRQQTFELVWKTIAETSFDPTFHGVDWNRVREQYRPQVSQAKDNKEFHQMLNKMVSELHSSHMSVADPEEVARALALRGQPNQLRNGTVGMSIRDVEGRMTVTEVDPDYPAAEAGIQPGFIIETVDGKSPADLYEDFRKEEPIFMVSEAIYRMRAVQRGLMGMPAAPVRLTYLDGQDHQQTVTLQRKARDTSLHFESRRLDSGFGYIRFNLWLGDLDEQFRRAVASLRDTAGLILDLRGNPGGIGSLSTAIASLLYRDAGSLGVTLYRRANEPFAFKGSGAAAYSGPIALLVDEATGSTSEVFSAGMQENGRAIVVGRTTVGGVLPAVQKPLPSGALLMHAVGVYRTPKGVEVEGKGVKPDVAVALKRKDLLEGKDAMLLAAERILSKK